MLNKDTQGKFDMNLACAIRDDLSDAKRKAFLLIQGLRMVGLNALAEKIQEIESKIARVDYNIQQLIVKCHRL